MHMLCSPQVSKLDPMSLKCIFVGYSRVQIWYKCYCLPIRRYFVSTDVTFFETTPFSLPSTVTRQGEEENLLVYTLASPIVSSDDQGGRIWWPAMKPCALTLQRVRNCDEEENRA